ncbi:hypothetical protein KP509_15G032800 [Ceratopteris richardii]|uniref:Bromo domain-containing protein n=1 Tax=Ceratopteris richardii TaxID=49495 RepID=A0A8T2T705_CERRI|nr:hypothetical protein KP509_15G032800 [Ceratopteris richardii]
MLACNGCSNVSCYATPGSRFQGMYHSKLLSKLASTPHCCSIFVKVFMHQLEVNIKDSQSVPTRKLMNFILDRLQKKDRFGIFAEPVDPKEVPNYYDIIKGPMDFRTMRSRIDSGHYCSIELFQKDIFLICDNAMQYNGKGTVYFRHARLIKEVTERIFEDLKVSGLNMEMDEPGIKLRNGTSSRHSEKHDVCMNMGSPTDVRLEDELSGYLFGRKSQAIDENRRSTYVPLSSSPLGNDCLLTTISGESAHFIPTGYQIDYPYSKSLARFAADLGPSVWKIAAEKIRKVLPQGCPFGPGWIGERESNNVVTAPSNSKQPSVHSDKQIAKFFNQNGVVTSSDTVLPEIQSKSDIRRQGNAKENHGMSKEDEHQSVVQRSAALATDMVIPEVFGNPPTQKERAETAHQTSEESPVPVQPIPKLRSSENNSRPVDKASLQAEKNFLKTDHLSIATNSKTKFAGQVNLNHPVSAQSDDGTSMDDGVSNQNMFRERDPHESTKLSEPGMSSISIHVVNGVGPASETSSFQNGTFDPRLLLTDRKNSVKTNPRETEMDTDSPTQFGGRAPGQIGRHTIRNENSNVDLGSIVTSNGKEDATYHVNNGQISHRVFISPGQNMPVHQPLPVSGMEMMDVGISLDSLRFSPSHRAKGYAFDHNASICIQQNPGDGHHSYSSNKLLGSRDASAAEVALSAQTAPGSQEQSPWERSNQNISFQQPSLVSGMKMKDGGVSSNSLHSGSSCAAKSFMFQQNTSTPIQRTSSAGHSVNSSNLIDPHDANPAELGLTVQPTLSCQERLQGGWFKGAGDMREKEMSSTTTVVQKGFLPEKGFTLQQMEPRTGRISGHGLVTSLSHSFDQQNRKQNTSVGPPVPSFLPNLNSSNVSSVLDETPGWVSTQHAESTQVVGKGDFKLQNEVPRNSVKDNEANAVFSHLGLQTSVMQDSQVNGYTSQKQVPNMPHFLMPQFGSNNIQGLHLLYQQAQIPSQSNPRQLQLHTHSHLEGRKQPQSHLQHVQQHMSSSSLLPASQNVGQSDSEWSLLRQFQLQSSPGFVQAGIQPWQFATSQTAAKVSNHSFAGAPDLNVSLPLPKSSFDQSNGSEVQQPDLALQL